ncbi:MAG: hypothetical protein NTX01_03505 [Candidatus Omnitrophica bacterium]|nr:hypothetical protein [Candidatus Omnitrophota bacterium]
MMPISSGNEKSVIREPLLAGILSFLFMGLGQAYNGQRRKGYMFFASYIGLAILYFILLRVFNEPFPKGGKEIQHTSPSYIVTAIFSFVICISNIYDAYRSAKRINESNEIVVLTPGKSSFVFLRTIFLWFISIIVLFIGLMFLFAFFAFFLSKH